MFENIRRGRQATNFTTNAPKILDLNSSSEQIFSRKLPLGAHEARPFYPSCTMRRAYGIEYSARIRINSKVNVSPTFVSFLQIPFKLGNFINLKALFSALSTDFP